MHLCIGLNRNRHISICRKTAGGGGYAINLGADANTLEIEGEENLSVYHAKLYDRGGPGEVPISGVERNFCRHCGSCLWVYDPRWPDPVRPFASTIDTTLPKSPERVHVALEFAAPWCKAPEGENERRFALWPEESIAQWHRRHGLEQP